MCFRRVQTVKGDKHSQWTVEFLRHNVAKSNSGECNEAKVEACHVVPILQPHEERRSECNVAEEESEHYRHRHLMIGALTFINANVCLPVSCP